MIVLTNVSKNYGKRTVLDRVSFHIEPGEFVCITGPSGAGKSTLLHMITAAERPSKGTVEVDGVSLSSLPSPLLQLYRRRIGVVFQDYKLLPNLTIAENIAFPMDVCGVPHTRMQRRTHEVIREMGLSGHGKSFPEELSGGEQARASIGRAIIHDPLIILADEPTGNLDPKQSLQIMDIFREIHKKGSTVILATHDRDIVNALGARVIRLENGAVTRDAAGGYSKISHTKHTDAPEGKHQIFAGTSRENPKKGGKNTIKITSVNGRKEDLDLD